MRFLLFIVVVLGTTSGFARGPFGAVTKKTFSSGKDQSTCTAERLLENAIEDTGIDIIDGSARQVWECKKGQGPATAADRRCPYDQYMKSESYKCYSNVSSGYPYICLSGARSAMVEETYVGDKKPSLAPRARFAQAFIFQGDQKVKDIQMDNAGCEATEVKGWDSTGLHSTGTTKSTKEQCLKRLKASLEGGYIYPPEAATKYSPERPGIKHCEASKAKDEKHISAHLKATKELFYCYNAFPNLDSLMAASYLGSGARRDGAKGQKPAR